MARSKWDPVPGSNLEKIRKASGLSMAQLAARVTARDVTDSTINKLEKAQIEFTMQWAYDLGEALRVEPFEFWGATRRLEPAAQALVDRFRGLSESDKQAVYDHADALAQRKPPAASIPHKKRGR
jgi:transcriptional regulator with XRE-family HTH domain